jgi:hypothetical protein
MGGPPESDPKPDEIALSRLYPVNLRTWPLIGAKHELDGELRALIASVYGFDAPVEYLTEAARRIFTAANTELIPFQDSVLRGRAADELGSAIAYAITGLYAQTGNWGPVKDVQLEATRRHPLAICGRGFREGCGLVFPDSRRRSAHPFPTWCRRCGDSGLTRRYQEREVKNARRPGGYRPPPSLAGYQRAETLDEKQRLRDQVVAELRGRLETSLARQDESRRISSGLDE